VPSPLRTTTHIFFQLNTVYCSPYVTSSLTRGWVCRLQLQLALARAVILGSESLGIHDHILLSQTRDSKTWRARSPYLYPPGTGWPIIPPGTGFPFHHLLRLVGLWWRYSNPPPHGVLPNSTASLGIRSTYIDEARTTHRKNSSSIVACGSVGACWGSHVIATQLVYWRAGCCVAMVASRIQRKHCSYCFVFVWTCLLSRCLATGFSCSIT
jgi:hypothetical protein